MKAGDPVGSGTELGGGAGWLAAGLGMHVMAWATHARKIVAIRDSRLRTSRRIITETLQEEEEAAVCRGQILIRKQGCPT